MATKPEKKLAAIMFTDIFGYTELTSVDENKALSIYKRLGDKSRIAGILRTFSEYLDQRCNDDKSLKYQIEAKEIYSQIGNKFF